MVKKFIKEKKESIDLEKKCVNKFLFESIGGLAAYAASKLKYQFFFATELVATTLIPLQFSYKLQRHKVFY